MTGRAQNNLASGPWNFLLRMSSSSGSHMAKVRMLKSIVEIRTNGCVLKRSKYPCQRSRLPDAIPPTYSPVQAKYTRYMAESNRKTGVPLNSSIPAPVSRSSNVNGCVVDDFSLNNKYGPNPKNPNAKLLPTKGRHHTFVS